MDKVEHDGYIICVVKNQQENGDKDFAKQISLSTYCAINSGNLEQ